MAAQVRPQGAAPRHRGRILTACLLAVLLLGSGCSNSDEESPGGLASGRSQSETSVEGAEPSGDADARADAESGDEPPSGADGGSESSEGLPGPPSGGSPGGQPSGDREELTISEVDSLEPDGPMAKPAKGPVPAKGRYVYDFGQGGSPSPWFSVIGTVDHTADGYSFEEDSSSAGGGMRISVKLTYAVSNGVHRVKRDHSMQRYSCTVSSGTYRQYSVALTVGDTWSYDATCGNERTIGSDEVVAHKVVTVDGTVVQVAEIRRAYEVKNGGSVSKHTVVEQISLEHRLLVRRDETVAHNDGQPSKQWLQLRSLRQL